MSKGRVLIVDDEADIRKAVRLILTKAGYDVDEAEDPEAGVALVKSGVNKLPVNAIITDLNMPKINEVIVVPYWRSQFPSCPIIVLSGSKMLERSAKLFRAAGVEFLTKPIDQEKLLGAVNKAANSDKSLKDIVEEGKKEVVSMLREYDAGGNKSGKAGPD